MSLYACSGCGTVNVGTPDECPTCGNDEYEAYEEFTCEECGESFDSKRGLSNHERVHDDDVGEDDEETEE